MKILWVSNATWVPSGYGNQTALFVPRLKAAGHDVNVLAFYGHQGSPVNMDGVTVFSGGYMTYGQDKIGPVSIVTQRDIAISLIDAWVMEPELHKEIAWCPWYPVDSEPLAPAVKRKIEKAFKRIVFSRFGEKMTNEAGLDCYYVPHGVNTSAYKPYDMKESRVALQWPTDRYVVGMVAANKGVPSRKAFTPQIKAFADFKKSVPEAALYLHTAAVPPQSGQMPQGVNLPEYVEFLGLTHAEVGAPYWHEADVWFSNQYYTFYGFSEQYMAQMYSALDAFLLVSMGEGFGIPILEAQACGCPVIVGDWSAMSELCFSGRMVSKQDADPWWTPLASYQYQPRSEAILDALIEEHRSPSNRKKAWHGAQAYDANTVTKKYWVPVLDEIGKALLAPEAVPQMNLVKF